MLQKLHRLALIAAALTVCVVVLGAWVRLSHAGLGCPDWPGCYGQLTWPSAAADLDIANEAFPDRPVEVDKAWREMVHRYLAGFLVLMVLALNWVTWKGKEATSRFRLVAGVTLVLILFQAALGMWTVTLKLLPVVVMGHLMGGLATLAMLSWIAFRSKALPGAARGRGWVLVCLAVLLAQIALGGWTSANYAALACPDFPTCTGVWWPETDFEEAYQLTREIGVDYEGGILDQTARATIHATHRAGAVITLIVLFLAGLRLRTERLLEKGAVVMMGLIGLQFVLGMLNVVLKLPLWVAVAHNGTAALLMMSVIWLLSRTTPPAEH